MSILASEDKPNIHRYAHFGNPPTPTPTKAKGKKVVISALKSSILATSLKLHTILKRNAKDSDQEWSSACASGDEGIIVPTPNAHIQSIIADITTYNSQTTSDDPRTELDSHTNTVVLGASAFVFESTGKSYNVQPFDSKLGTSLSLMGLWRMNTLTMGTYILIVRNALT